MVEIEIETIKFIDLKQLKIKGYKLDEDLVYSTETVSYVCENNEDSWIDFTMAPEFDSLGYEVGSKGVVAEFYEHCSVVETIHFPPSITWNAIQAFLDRKFK
jgi:hypothetical protein